MNVHVSETDYLVCDDTAWEIASELPPVGIGCSRVVVDLQDGTVLKLQRNNDAGMGSNLTEWSTWQDALGGPWERFLAPCVAIGDGGAWMVQQKALRPLEHSEWVAWWEDEGRQAAYVLNLGDIHESNVGIMPNGEIRIFDYACQGFADMVDALPSFVF